MADSQRVSEYFDLGETQGTLDFVDVYVDGDIPLFIDPSVLASVNSEWADDCTSSIQGFFQAIIDLILAGDEIKAKALLSHLGEDNSTRLGYSSRNKGSGVGAELAEEFYKDLSSSQALESGYIRDIEDTALFIEGVREDRVSDVVTNIIRRQLIEYTQSAADYYRIPLAPNVATRSCWNNQERRWDVPRYYDLPIAGGEPILLVPKSIVRRRLYNNPDEYYRYYVLPFFQNEEIRKRSPLVQLLKSGEPRVLKKDVEAKYKAKHESDALGVLKRINLDATDQNAELLDKFKRDKAAHPPAALSHEEIANTTGTPQPNYDALLEDVLSIETGKDTADQYERAVEALLNALLYPSLVNPKRQFVIHEGRKRIDIAYTNMAVDGFFRWLANHHPSGHIFVECKNYSRPLANPEFDQIAGRFSPSRGKYGLLVYRAFSDKSKILESLRDTAKDDRGFVTALDDGDLKELVNEMKLKGTATGLDGLLDHRFKALIN
ncbi:hypothetical protein QN239_19195 [Mycolicibacterium sp. Y3]